MNERFSEETKQQIISELFHDIAEMGNLAQRMNPPFYYLHQNELISQMNYISAQIRLKLHLLGAAISSEEVGQ